MGNHETKSLSTYSTPIQIKADSSTIKLLFLEPGRVVADPMFYFDSWAFREWSTSFIIRSWVREEAPNLRKELETPEDL